MRKILIFLGLLFVMLSNIYAQKGRQAIGFGLSYGTEIESIGLGLKYQYNITNPIRLEPSLNYFIENDNVSMLDVNMNLHYLCPVGRSVKLYPLFGFTFSNWMFDLGDGFDSSTEAYLFALLINRDNLSCANTEQEKATNNSMILSCLIFRKIIELINTIKVANISIKKTINNLFLLITASLNHQ